MRRPVAKPTVWSPTEADERRTRIYYWWLLLAIVFEYVRPAVFFPPIDALKLNSLIPLGLFALVLFAPGMRPSKAIFADPSARWIAVFLGLLLLSVPLVPVTLYAFDVFKRVLAHVILFIIVARVVTTEQRLRGVFVALIASHLFLLMMNPALVLNPEIRTYVEGAPFLGDGNDYALSLCILLPMAIALARGARSQFGKGLAWAAFVLMLLAIVGTQSRGAALAVIAIFGFLWLTSARKGAALIGIGAAMLIVVLFASDAYFNRMGTITDYESEGSARGRILAWKAGARMALDHPVFGVGAGHFPHAYGTQYRPPDAGSMRWMTAHSMYFLVLGELGLTGIITYCILVFGGIRATLMTRRSLLRSARAPPSEQSSRLSDMLGLLAASAIGFAVGGAFLSASYYPHLYVLTGILLSARAVALAAGHADGAGQMDAAKNVYMPRNGRRRVGQVPAQRPRA